ncbi:MAG: recombination mediator RecR [Rhodobacteraceae bacterium]|nr:recombination mediator RecR [Paracoccaceae bacterium]
MASDNAVDALIKQLARLPGLGPRSSRRIVLHLVKRRQQQLDPLVAVLTEFQETVVSCKECGNVAIGDLCPICTSEERVANVICIVESVADLWALERSRMYKGLYHVLGGVLSAATGVGPEELGIPRLIERVQELQATEVILGLGATVEGQATAHYIAEQIQHCNATVTSLGRGIPMGGELDYLDSGTIAASLIGRRELT